MAFLMKNFIKFTERLDEFGDKRTENDLFIKNILFGLLPVLAVYNYFVWKLGPNIMQNMKPFQLKNVMTVYNAFQVLSCGYISYLAFSVEKYGLVCQSHDTSNSEIAQREMRVWRYFYYIKIIDILDTVFFVLRKKFNQVTFLHVYHHTGMIILGWIGVKYFPGGTDLIIPMVNSFVHCVMYTYYLLTVWDRQRRLNWVKKYITLIQMVQFCYFVFMSSLFTFQSECHYPKMLAAIFMVQNVFMLCLFGDFYRKSYLRKKIK